MSQDRAVAVVAGDWYRPAVRGTFEAMRTSPLAIVAVLGLLGCSGSDVSREVGARCSSANDCDERCLTGHWPGGFCSVSCVDDFDCPENAVCIQEDGGVCAFGCIDSSDCQFLSDGYVCKDVDHRVTGKVDVCRGD